MTQPFNGQQNVECKVNKIILEYKPLNHQNWILLSKSNIQNIHFNQINLNII